MDGIHDVGGRQGFGPIKITDTDLPFPTDWEARAFGITNSVTSASDYSSDKFRYTREQLPPLEYLTAPYFEQWMRCAMSMLVGSGLVTAEELATGRSDGTIPAGVGPAKTKEEARAGTRAPVKFDGPFNGAPEFASGDGVMVKLNAPRGHTRLPQYVRGRFGHVVCYHGAHGVPEDNIKNIKTFEPFYTVAFALTRIIHKFRGFAAA